MHRRFTYAITLFVLFAVFAQVLTFVPGDVPELSDPDFPIRDEEVDDLFDQLLDNPGQDDE